MSVNKKIKTHVALVWLFLAISCCSLLVENGLADAVIFSVFAPGSVINGAKEPVFNLSQDQFITKIRTYHWNDGNGASPGSIKLVGPNGDVGSWSVRGEPDVGVLNVYWVAYPNVKLSPGAYRVVDSDASTWSQNSGTGGLGFTWVFAS